MKDYMNEIQYNGERYVLVFNLNVMEAIQEEYGTIEKWGELTDGASGEPDAKAIIFGFREMINEGIDIDNETAEVKEPLMTLKQVGRLISEVGFENATLALNDTVVESTKSEEKNS